MIDLLPALPPVPTTTAPPGAVADGSAASPGSFGQTLGAFLDAHAAAVGEPTLFAAVPERQSAAEPGKDLPLAATDQADARELAELPFWFAAFPLPAAEIAPAPTVGIAAPQPATLQPATLQPAISQPVTPLGGDQPIAAPREQRAVANERPAEAVGPTGAPPVTADALLSQAVPPKVLNSASPPVSDKPQVALMPAIDAPTNPASSESSNPPDTNLPPPLAAVDTSAPAIAVSTIAQPAGQVFATARAIAGAWREREPRGDRAETTVFLTTSAPIELRERAIVHAAAGSAHAALDLTEDGGLQRMIDRIETLRDAADAKDTRVRLIPDALGSIDVAVRQEGDRVHVRFTAEHDATRALIADAQPRLTELAAARGVRIGDTSVSTGTGGGGPSPQPRPTVPRTPASPMRAAETDFTTDHRLA